MSIDEYLAALDDGEWNGPPMVALMEASGGQDASRPSQPPSRYRQRCWELVRRRMGDADLDRVGRRRRPPGARRARTEDRRTRDRFGLARRPGHVRRPPGDRIGTVDGWGDYPAATLVGVLVGVLVGSTLMAIGMTAYGRWLRSEEPVTVAAKHVAA